MKQQLLDRKTDRLLTSGQVLELTGFKSRGSLWKKSRDPNDSFPLPVKDGGHFTRWKESELVQWMENLEYAL